MDGSTCRRRPAGGVSSSATQNAPNAPGTPGVHAGWQGGVLAAAIDLPAIAEALVRHQPAEVFRQHPVQRRQAIEKRRVEMLEAMERPALVVGREAEEIA